MFNTLLFIHLIIAILLIIVILLQRTSTDGLSGIGDGGGNMGLVSGRSAANFMTRTTIVLAVMFFANALVLANLSSRATDGLTRTMETEISSNGTAKDTSPEEQQQDNALDDIKTAPVEDTALPVAK